MFGITQNYLRFQKFLHVYDCVLLPTKLQHFSARSKNMQL